MEGRAGALILLIAVAAVIPGHGIGRADGGTGASLSPAPFAKRSPSIILREDIFQKSFFASCHASSIVETRDGFVAVWFGGTAEGRPDVGIWLSRHNGSAWSPPVEVAAGLGADGQRQPCWNPVLFLTGRGRLLMFYKVGPDPAHWWGMLAASEDHGRTWAAPRRLPDGILGPAKNHPVEFPDGTILCGSSTEDNGWRAHFEWTRDGGRTWNATDPVNDGRGVGLIQPALLRTGGRGVAALLRSDAGRIYLVRSRDGGKTWSNPEALAVPNPNSGLDAVALRDRRYVLVGNATARGRGILSVLMATDVRNWTRVLDLEDEADAEFSYPAVIQSRDGRVHVTYTWKRLRIRHVVLDPGD